MMEEGHDVVIVTVYMSYENGHGECGLDWLDDLYLNDDFKGGRDYCDDKYGVNNDNVMMSMLLMGMMVGQ